MPHSPSPKRRAQKRTLSPGSPDASDPESVPGNKVPRPDSVAEAKEGSPVPGPSTLDASGPESEPGDFVARPNSVAEAKECSPHPGHDLGDESALSGHASTASASGTGSEDMCHEVPIHDLSFDQDEFPGWSTPCRERMERTAKSIKIMSSKKSCINSPNRSRSRSRSRSPIFHRRPHLTYSKPKSKYAELLLDVPPLKHSTSEPSTFPINKPYKTTIDENIESGSFVPLKDPSFPLTCSSPKTHTTPPQSPHNHPETKPSSPKHKRKCLKK